LEIFGNINLLFVKGNANNPDIVIITSYSGTAYPGLQIETEGDLVKFADEAMYSVKNSGRN